MNSTASPSRQSTSAFRLYHKTTTPVRAIHPQSVSSLNTASASRDVNADIFAAKDLEIKTKSNIVRPGNYDILKAFKVNYLREISIRYILPLFLIYPLLFGLLFSGGEGITLLPFPDIGAERPVDSVEYPSPALSGTGCHINIKAAIQTKTQARDFVHQVFGTADIDALPFRAVTRTADMGRGELPEFKRSPAVGWHGGRAPPNFESI